MIVSGNVALVLASEGRPLPAVTLTEVLATSDVPGGVVNLLTGYRTELIPVLAAHEDVDAIDLWGVPDALRRDTEIAAAEGIKRLARRPAGVADADFDRKHRPERAIPTGVFSRTAALALGAIEMALGAAILAVIALGLRAAF